jgi:hypothetical protein
VTGFGDGVHRVSAATLDEFSCALSVPIGYLFEGLSHSLLGRLMSSGPVSSPSPGVGSNLQRVTTEHFNPLEDRLSRFQVLRLIKLLEYTDCGGTSKSTEGRHTDGEV